MSYRVLVDSRAARSLEKMPRHAVERIDKAIAQLAKTPGLRASNCFVAVSRKDGIRVGEYRILHRIDDHVREVRIFEIGHRREVYR